jgi:hypothetical protein
MNAPKRRVDNEVSRLSDSVCVLQMHCKIIEDISSKYQAALLRSRLSLAAALCTSVLLPSAAIIGISVMPDSSIALSLSSTVLLGQPLIALLAATTGDWQRNASMLDVSKNQKKCLVAVFMSTS